MKITVFQPNLREALGIVARAVAMRCTLPVLSNILLEADPARGRLRLSATNLEMAISAWIPCHDELGDAPQAITLPARTLIDLVSILPADTVTMSLNARTNTVNIKCARYENNVRGIGASEFPVVSGQEVVQVVGLSPDLLREIIEQVVYAAADDQSRPIITGVLCEFHNKAMMTLAATDGFRLAVRIVAGLNVLNETKVIVPAKALTELARIIPSDCEVVTVHITPSRSQMIFKAGSVELVSQLIDGNFPDYIQIIPKKHETSTVVSTGDLLKVCKAASVFARESNDLIKLSAENGAEPGKVTVRAVSAETGDGVGELDAMVNGEPVTIAFNVKFLMQALGVIGTPFVELRTNGSVSPGLLLPTPGDVCYKAVLMPMHLT